MGSVSGTEQYDINGMSHICYNPDLVLLNSTDFSQVAGVRLFIVLLCVFISPTDIQSTDVKSQPHSSIC